MLTLVEILHICITLSIIWCKTDLNSEWNICSVSLTQCGLEILYILYIAFGYSLMYVM